MSGRNDEINRSKYPELLSDLAAQAAEVLQEKYQFTMERAADAGFDIAERIRKTWQGHSVYMPQAMLWELNNRDLEIWQKYNGRNIHKLSDEYGLTEVRIYQIIKRVRAEETRRRQSDLFKERERA